MRVESLLWLRQFVKFCLVGSSNFLVSFSVYFVLYNVLNTWSNAGSPAEVSGTTLHGADWLNRLAGSYAASIANCIAYGAGILNSFIWNRRWTFSAADRLKLRFGRFIALNGLCVVLSTTALYSLVDLLGYPYKSTWLAVMVLITLLNFLSCKYWVAEQLAG